MAGPTSALHTYLRAWRQSRGLTLEQLGNEIGSKTNTISGWETGSRTVDLDDLQKIADVYGVHPAALLFAPEGDPQFEGMKQASGILKKMPSRQARIWLELGQSMTEGDKPAHTEPEK